MWDKKIENVWTYIKNKNYGFGSFTNLEIYHTHSEDIPIFLKIDSHWFWKGNTFEKWFFQTFF